MRFSQPKEEIPIFSKAFEDLLLRHSVGYIKNAFAKGTRTEFIKEIQNGIFASHSSFCHRGRYNHCFAVILHKELSDPYLNSPFVAGGRFDHNYGINMAFQRDLKRSPLDKLNPLRLSDSHEMRKGFEQIIEKCIIESEKYLLPFYLTILKLASSMLIELINTHLKIGSLTTPQEEIPKGHGYIIPNDYDMNMIQFYEATAKMEKSKLSTFFRNVILAKPEYFNRIYPRIGELKKSIENLSSLDVSIDLS
jgi:hypothetical protein